ncbi:MAG: hypothetical protein COX57_03675 [Alphaproteobacteria bacterium CG_4_10_14_0_2_um_filter_63_37]|nr:MAG: hypothetical protein COX57_03675 [Alphaproteobacteria bacterium CG_4_10_14_0_2_um_filter_63_37]
MKANMRLPLFLLSVWALLLASPLALAEEPPPATILHRPSIGLVLGGGGARGAAHVGVLKVLESLHIPIDYVAGTSFGAIVGGLYASGLSPEQIEALMQSVDWGDALRDASPRNDLTFRRKEDDRAYQVGATLGFHNDGIPALPRGLIEGQRLGFLLKKFALHTAYRQDFNQLPIPFRAVAVDLVSGKPVVLDHGDLATAMRASMSIPGLISPVPWVEEDGTRMLLIDGGIDNNLPIDVARAMGADIVIAVNVGAPLYKADQLDSVVSVTDQVTTLVTIRNTQAQIATIGAQDILIQPRLTGIGSGSFDKAMQAVSHGARAAQNQIDQLAQLAQLALTAESFAQWQQAHQHPAPPPPSWLLSTWTTVPMSPTPRSAPASVSPWRNRSTWSSSETILPSSTAWSCLNRSASISRAEPDPTARNRPGCSST